MSQPVAVTLPDPRARTTGVIYLVYFLTAIGGEVFLKGIVVSDDAAATANHILTHLSSYRVGVGFGLLSTACYAVLVCRFWKLFALVNNEVSSAAALFGTLGCAILAFATLFRLGPLILLDRGYLGAFPRQQINAIALLSLDLFGRCVEICFVFFGIYCVLLGYLVYRSLFLPRLLGAWLVLAGAGWLLFLYPAFADHYRSLIVANGFFAEVAFMLWLLAMGVNVSRWQERCRGVMKPC